MLPSLCNPNALLKLSVKPGKDIVNFLILLTLSAYPLTSYTVRFGAVSSVIMTSCFV